PIGRREMTGRNAATSSASNVPRPITCSTILPACPPASRCAAVSSRGASGSSPVFFTGCATGVEVRPASRVANCPAIPSICPSSIRTGPAGGAGTATGTCRTSFATSRTSAARESNRACWARSWRAPWTNAPSRPAIRSAPAMISQRMLRLVVAGLIDRDVSAVSILIVIDRERPPVLREPEDLGDLVGPGPGNQAGRARAPVVGEEVERVPHHRRGHRRVRVGIRVRLETGEGALDPPGATRRVDAEGRRAPVGAAGAARSGRQETERESKGSKQTELELPVDPPGLVPLKGWTAAAAKRVVANR